MLKVLNMLMFYILLSMERGKAYCELRITKKDR